MLGVGITESHLFITLCILLRRIYQAVKILDDALHTHMNIPLLNDKEF